MTRMVAGKATNMTKTAVIQYPEKRRVLRARMPTASRRHPLRAIWAVNGPKKFAAFSWDCPAVSTLTTSGVKRSRSRLLLSAKRGQIPKRTDRKKLFLLTLKISEGNKEQAERSTDE
jgi:hypothetical protein